jgi:hypothetical protein
MSDTDVLAALVQDLTTIFKTRLRAVASYGASVRTDTEPITTLALVDHLTGDDLRRCASRAQAWHNTGIATPLLLGEREFARSLDAFPFEFGAILDDYAVVAGSDPFTGLRVAAADLRRACEVQARSHLLHLREGFIETRGRDDAIASLIVRSAAPLAALLRNLARLPGVSPADSVLARVVQLEHGAILPASEAAPLFPDYLRALEQLVNTIDTWDRV